MGEHFDDMIPKNIGSLFCQDITIKEPRSSLELRKNLPHVVLMASAAIRNPVPVAINFGKYP